LICAEESYVIAAPDVKGFRFDLRADGADEKAVDSSLHDHLKTIRTELPRLAELLKLEAGAELASGARSWTSGC